MYDIQNHHLEKVCINNIDLDNVDWNMYDESEVQIQVIDQR